MSVQDTGASLGKMIAAAIKADVDAAYERGVKAGKNDALESAARVAEQMFYFHTPDDGVIDAQPVADAIRKLKD